MKLAITPGGGRMLGMFANPLTSAISSGNREFGIELPRERVQNDYESPNPPKKGLLCFAIEEFEYCTVPPF